MKLYASGEDYLEAILVLQNQIGKVRSIDLSRHMEVSKASVSHAIKILREGGFLTMDGDGFLHLTEIGQDIAAKIYERHCFFRKQLIEAGVKPQIAEIDACKLEHVVSDESFMKLKEASKKK